MPRNIIYITFSQFHNIFLLHNHRQVGPAHKLHKEALKAEREYDLGNIAHACTHTCVIRLVNNNNELLVKMYGSI
jgi:hypothetical protein